MNSNIKAFSYLLCLLLLAACSGSGSSTQDSTPVQISSSGSALGSIAIAKTALQLNEATSVSVTFKKTDGTPAVGVNVNFSTTMGTIAPASGIAVTDANGIATVQLTVGAVSGQGQITASATVDNKQVTKIGLFSVSLPPLKLSAVTLGLATLSYGGSTSVTVTVQDSSGATFTGQEVDVAFSSTQASSGKATITSPVRTVNGVATVTYQATTATGSDTITAAIAGDSKTASITVNPLAAGAITFVSVSPPNIGLKGMGGFGIQETSKVVFKVLDTAGQPRANQQVDFALNTTVGGLSIIPVSGSTATDGTVSTIVQAGTIATPVRVTATIRGTSPLISTQSDQLVVSTGVPAQDGFSVAIETLNPEAWNIDGVTDKVTARLSDHFHNPVPDGTAVYFTTSGGSIQPSCTTVAGACTVTWTSQAPRPANGRARILAYAVGEEAFLDLNGNGLADAGEFADTSEAFRDDNENNARDAGETFIDFNSDGVFNGPDGKYNGVLQGAAYVGAPKSKHVFSNSTIVMASSSPDLNTLSISPLTVGRPAAGSTYGITTTLTLTVLDKNGNAMPAGTTITVGTSVSAYLTVSENFTVPNTIDRGIGISTFSVPVYCNSTSAGSGVISVTIKTPAGLTTVQNITITY